MVEPNEYVSGSTSLACWLILLVNVSVLIFTVANAGAAVVFCAAAIPHRQSRRGKASETVQMFPGVTDSLPATIASCQPRCWMFAI